MSNDTQWLRSWKIVIFCMIRASSVRMVDMTVFFRHDTARRLGRMASQPTIDGGCKCHIFVSLDRSSFAGRLFSGGIHGPPDSRLRTFSISRTFNFSLA